MAGAGRGSQGSLGRSQSALGSVLAWAGEGWGGNDAISVRHHFTVVFLIEALKKGRSPGCLLPSLVKKQHSPFYVSGLWFTARQVSSSRLLPPPLNNECLFFLKKNLK